MCLRCSKRFRRETIVPVMPVEEVVETPIVVAGGDSVWETVKKKVSSWSLPKKEEPIKKFDEYLALEVSDDEVPPDSFYEDQEVVSYSPSLSTNSW